MKKMARFRIYTEYVHTRHIAEIVNKYFAAYSMFSGIGHYENEKERCLVIEIITDVESALVDIEVVCREINQANRQDCCLVTVEKVEVFYVGGKK